MFLDALANPNLDKFDLSTLRKGIAAKTSDKCNLPSRRLQVICMGARKNLTRQGTLEKRWGVCPSRTLFSLSLITSKRLLNRVKEVVRKCGAINHENKQYLLNSSWVNDHSWLGKPLCQSLILYIKRLCLATRLRGTKHFSRSISFAFSPSLKPNVNFNARKLAWTRIFPVH